MLKIKNFIRQFAELYWDKNNVDLLLFDIISLTGIGAGIIVMTLCALMKQPIINTLVGMSAVIVAAFGFFLANIKHRIGTASLVMCLFATTIVFPAMFLLGGGYHSGTPVWYVLGIVFCFMLLQKEVLVIMVVLDLMVYSSTFMLAYYRPDLIGSIGNEQINMLDILASFLGVGIGLGLVTKFQAGIYRKQVEINQQHVEELKQVNEEAERARVMAMSASQAKSSFLANMSHEIRTPLNAVLGMDELILRREQDPELKAYAADIQIAGKALLSLINDILDFSKIESGRMDIIPVKYEVSSLLNDVCNMISEKAKEKNLTFLVGNSSKLPRILLGDEVRIRQIMINLLSNAVKYTKEGKVLLNVDYREQNSDTIMIRISVKDSGIGIKKEDLEQLFKSFKRVDEEVNRNIEGTGLGLSLVKNLTELMGGTVSVSSTYGVGSEFVVELPQKVIDPSPMGDFGSQIVAVEAANVRYEKSFYASSARILVVDDVPMNLQVFSGLLRDTGVRVDTALSGMKCIEKMKTNAYHMVFLDHMMPEMDGVETLVKIKELRKKSIQEDNVFPNMDTPIIMLTANAIMGMKEEYLESGFSDYLSKPCKGDTLEAMVLKYLPKEIIEKGIDTNEEEMFYPFKGKIRKLREIRELDLRVAMDYCSQDEEMFIDILQEFIHQDLLDDLDNCYKDSDWKNYAIAAHALKSSALTVGFVILSEEAKGLELAAKNNSIRYIESEHDFYIEHCRELFRLIEDILAGSV